MTATGEAGSKVNGCPTVRGRYTDGKSGSAGLSNNLSPSESDTMHATLLLIEDESAIADTVIYALEKDGFRVLWHQLAREGEDCLERENVDLLILDIGLPDDNGFEFCRRIRAHHQLPVIFLTARKEEVDRVVGLEIGADDYVTKPFGPRELAARVRAVLRRAQGGQTANSPTVDPSLFAIDDQRKQIRYQGQWLELTQHEYRILQLLVSRPGQVFSREQLLERAWDDPGQSFDRAVDTHIKTLRAKLKRIDSERQPIRTHRGFGYSMRPEDAA